MTEKEIKKLLSEGEHANLECKKAQGGIPRSIWETYSAFANTDGGVILLGVDEVRSDGANRNRLIVIGVSDVAKLQKEFWDTINSDKLSVNILNADDVEVVDVDGMNIIAIHVPRASYNFRPVYVNGNPAKGTFKRNHEGDYHCSESEWKSMVRDSSDDGNDGQIVDYYTMDDIDLDALHRYRTSFMLRNAGHVWEDVDDKSFLINMGGYAMERRTQREGLTMAGLLMFGKGLPVREVFDNFRMDYLDFTHCLEGERYSDRLTYDGRWENNLYNFVRMIVPKLTIDLKVPFRLNGMVREDDTPVHKAIREALTNSIIHADMLTTGVLRIEKRTDGFFFSNPGILRLSLSSIYEGMHTKARNPRIQQMFRMIGYGENIGSGFPSILKVWKEERWAKPELTERQDLNEVHLMLKLEMDKQSSDNLESSSISSCKSSDKMKSSDNSSENDPENVQKRPEPSGNSPEKDQKRPENVQKTSRKISAKKLAILAYLRDNPFATRKKLTENIENLSWASSKYQLAQLKKLGYLDRVGSDRTGRWIVKWDEI